LEAGVLCRPYKLNGQAMARGWLRLSLGLCTQSDFGHQVLLLQNQSCHMLCTVTIVICHG